MQSLHRKELRLLDTNTYQTLSEACTATGVLSASTWTTYRKVLQSPLEQAERLDIATDETTAEPVLTDAPDNCACENAVIKVDYQFISSSGTITGALADVSTTTLTAATCTTRINAQQIFSASFLTSENVTPIALLLITPLSAHRLYLNQAIRATLLAILSLLARSRPLTLLLSVVSKYTILLTHPAAFFPPRQSSS